MSTPNSSKDSNTENNASDEDQSLKDVSEDDKNPPASNETSSSNKGTHSQDESSCSGGELEAAVEARIPSNSDSGSNEKAARTGLQLAPGTEASPSSPSYSKSTVARIPSRTDSRTAPGSFAESSSKPFSNTSMGSSGLALAPGVEPSPLSIASGSSIVTVPRSESTVPGAERVRGVNYAGDSPSIPQGRKSIIPVRPPSPTTPPPPSPTIPPPPSTSPSPTPPTPPPPPPSFATAVSTSTPSGIELVIPPGSPTTNTATTEGGDGGRGNAAPMLKAERVDEPVLARAVTVRFWTGKKVFRSLVLILLVMLLIVVGLTFGLSSRTSGNKNSLTPEEKLPIRPTLETVREDGVLRCGVQNHLDGFSTLADKTTNQRVGFEIDLCMAVAAAVFGDSFDAKTNVEPVVVASAERWTALADRSIDLVTRTTTHTMERDVYQQNALMGFSFSVPYLYDGLGFAGIPPYPTCADEQRVTDDCNGLRICTFGNSTHWDVLSDKFPKSKLIVVNASYTRLDGFLDGQCNVMAGISHEISEVVAIKAGYNGAFENGTVQFTKEPLALVTRQDDRKWSDFVNLVLQGLMEAEEQNVTQDTADLLVTNVNPGEIFGEEFARMLIHAVRAVGNYGEMYNRHIEPLVPRQQVNSVRTIEQSSGILYALPFGRPHEEGPGPLPGGTLELIQRRGYLRCGVHGLAGGSPVTSKNPLTELNQQYCRAISASIFSEVLDRIAYIAVPTRDDNVDPFELGISHLQSGEVDVLAGASARNAPLDSVTVSPPYHYFENATISETTGDAMALATRNDDPQWSDFVFWVVTSTITAEEESITSDLSNSLPAVELFGPTYDRMFRDARVLVGHVGDLYERSANVSSSSLSFRGNLNKVNDETPWGPQFYPLL